MKTVHNVSVTKEHVNQGLIEVFNTCSHSIYPLLLTILKQYSVYLTFVCCVNCLWKGGFHSYAGQLRVLWAKGLQVSTEELGAQRKLHSLYFASTNCDLKFLWSSKRIKNVWRAYHKSNSIKTSFQLSCNEHNKWRKKKY